MGYHQDHQDERQDSGQNGASENGSTTSWAMNDDQFGNLLAAIMTAGTLAASHRGLIEARMVPTYFFQLRAELRAAGIIHRNRGLARRPLDPAAAKAQRKSPAQFGEV
jgi:hypothetical protein